MSERIELWVVAETESEIELDSATGARQSGDTGPTFGSPKTITEKIVGMTRKRVPVDVALLKAQMNGMLRVVNELYSQAEDQTGMQLDEVELKVEINAEGQLSLVGNGGKLSNTGGISLKFSRSKD